MTRQQINRTALLQGAAFVFVFTVASTAALYLTGV